MYLFFEKGIRDGNSQCSNRHSKANKNMQLTYIDGNNFYDHSLSQELPQKYFDRLTSDEVENTDYSLNSDEDTGYVVEVDMFFPRELEHHKRCNNLPLAPESAVPPGGKVEKPFKHL